MTKSGDFGYSHLADSVRKRTYKHLICIHGRRHTVLSWMCFFRQPAYLFSFAYLEGLTPNWLMKFVLKYDCERKPTASAIS